MKSNTNYSLIAGIIIIIIFTITFSLLYLSSQFSQIEDDKYVLLGDEAPILTELHPIVKENKNILLKKAAEIDIDVIITEGLRPFEKQDELYNQGRSTKGNIVTYSKGGESFHNYGLAFDYAIKNANGGIEWDIEYDGNHNGESDWFEVAKLAKELGFEWGGDWRKFKDYPHLQMTFGLSIPMLQEGYRLAEDNKTK
ncbi:M15 family metallopeptidase [Viridibacillus arvi]|uniref:M15 family metallopeptidase n=1 Tax=Viridibacillus arvi TaxID=263475 RepID=UPI00187B89C8|nr:M15 family metallopeptidase [Viridibacillus sp. JNUCC-6]